MAGSYVSGRPLKKRAGGGGGMKWNSTLPKGNQHTTPERAEIRAAEAERKASAEVEFTEGRKALNQVLGRDPEAIRRVWEKMVGLAEGGHYKAGELVLGYAYGKPIATQLSASQEFSGDDLFEATESVRAELGEGWQVVPATEADVAADA